MKEKNITLDDLARMVQKGFDHVDKRLTEIDNRVEKVDNRFDSIENGLSGLVRGQEDIQLRLDNCAHRFELRDLDRRLTTLERRPRAA